MHTFYRLLVSLLLAVGTTSYAAETAAPESSAAAKPEQPGHNRIFILDGSGSMWAQIQGKTKIEIAKTVMRQLVDELPATDPVSLLAYGHRRKGDCADVEQLYPLSAPKKGLLGLKIDGINPKGKTPITAAVKQAIAIVRNLEDEADIVLVSDGLETCAGDPCDAVRAAKAAGVNFRLHVVGFDLGDKDTGQLRCMAKESGGLYVGASDAGQLSAAMQQVVKAEPEPEQIGAATVRGPKSIGIGKRFEVQWTGPDAKSDYITIVESGQREGRYGSYAYTNSGPTVTLTATNFAGAYELRYVHGRTRKTLASQPIEIVDAAASLSAAETVGIGSAFAVSWEGPNNARDYITIVAADKSANAYGSYAYTKSGAAVTLTAPVTAGTYELRYITGGKRRILARRSIVVEEVGAALEAPDSIAAGAPLPVQWQGPDNKRDYITIVEPGAKAGKYGSYAYTSQGSPAKLNAPDIPGTYELRYVTAGKHRVLARKAIKVSAVTATLDAPASVGAGTKIAVKWTGPGNRRDYVTLIEPSAADNKYGAYKNARQGSPLHILAPDQPGDYELRYVTGQAKQVLARFPITVTAQTASINAPAQAMAGSPLKLSWQGPANARDYITIVQAGEDEGKYGPYQKTSKGSPLTLQMPEEPGNYELRYVTGQSRKTLARQALVLNPASASLQAPASVRIDQTIEVTWTGPGGSGDKISLAPAGSPDRTVISAKSARIPGTLFLRGHKHPGQYEIRYTTGQHKRVLARHALTIEDYE